MTRVILDQRSLNYKVEQEELLSLGAPRFAKVMPASGPHFTERYPMYGLLMAAH